MIEPIVIFPNADKVGPLLSLNQILSSARSCAFVYGEFLKTIIAGNRPDGSVDMVYCFARTARFVSEKGGACQRRCWRLLEILLWTWSGRD